MKNLIPRIGLTIVWGPPKCGKSFWVFDLVMHVALGREYRGRNVQQGPVVYLALEGAYGFRARIAAFRERYLADRIEPVPFFLVTEQINLSQDHRTLINDIKLQIGDILPAVVVIDTVNRSLFGSESNDKDMATYLRAASAISTAFDCSVIMIHHSGHDESRVRGHSSLLGNTDAELSVKRDAAQNVVVTVELLKDGPSGASIVSRLRQVEVGTDEDGEPITSCVIEPSDATAAKVQRAPSGQAKVAFDLLCEALAEGGMLPPGSKHIPPNTRTCPIDLWRRYCYAGTITESDKPDSKQKAFVRVSKQLQAFGLIGIWSDQVWIAGQAGQART